MNAYPGCDFTTRNIAVSGNALWSSLVRFETLSLYDLAMVAFDTAHSGDEDHHRQTLEAFIRRALDTFAVRLYHMRFFDVTNPAVDDPTTSPAMAAWLAAAATICQHYAGCGVAEIDYYGAVTALVNGGAHLADYFADTIHPTQTGQQLAADLLAAQFNPLAASPPMNLPARLHTGDYEHPATIKSGTAYDSKSGTWSEIGTRIESTEVGAIVTYSATCASYGCLKLTAGNNNVEISIDGGAYASGSFYQNGRPIATGRGLHTIAVKVAGGTVRIDEFWAI